MRTGLVSHSFLPKQARRAMYRYDKQNRGRSWPKKQAKVTHPNMMGDGPKSGILVEHGKLAAHIKENEVTAALRKPRPTK